MPSSSSIQLAVSQEALNQQLTTLLDTVIDGIIVINDDGIILSFNRAAQQIFGYTADEVLGRNISCLMPEPHHSRHDEYLARYQETGEARIIGIGREVDGLHKDGRRVPLDLAVSEMWIAEERFFTGVIRDITDRKRAESELAEKNRLLEGRAKLDQIENSVARIFSQREALETSLQAVLRVLADGLDAPVSGVWTYDEWTGLLRCVADHGSPSNLQRTFEFGEGIVGQVAREQRSQAIEKAPISIEVGLTSIEPATVIAAPLMYQERLLGVLVIAFLQPLEKRERIFVDRLANQLGTALHNLKQYEDLLELSRQLNARSREIARQNRELERANRLKSEFLANMSHELRTPLNAIIGFSEVLKDQLLGDLNEEQLDYTGEIFSAGRHLLSLINEILDLAKIEAGKMELHLEPTRPANLLERASSIIKEQALAEQIEVEIDVDESLPELYLDLRKTRQILFNLLSNAVKFTPSGGRVKLAAYRDDSLDGDALRLVVEDTGIGIAADDMERLFKPFEQVDGSISRRFEGTGLGLAMVERLTSLHGGRIEVESEVGSGSTFTVILPWRTSNLDSAGLESQEEIDVDTTLILLASSGGHVTAKVGAALESAGFAIRVCRPDQLVETANKIDLDLVVLEVSGTTDSLQNLIAFKESSQKPIPVVLLTIDEDAERGLSAGAAEVITKPIDSRILLDTIHRLGVQPRPGVASKVLVVDDDPRAVEFVSRQLENAGIEVLRAFGGQEAIEMADQEPDLMILDLMMPEVSGLDVIEAYRNNPVTADIPIIILTARVLEPAEHRQLARGVANVLEKRSFQASHLLREVRHALDPRVRHTPRSSTGTIGALTTLSTTLSRPSSQRGLSRGKILVVESHPRDRQLLQIYLEDEGFEVEAVADGHDGIARLDGGFVPALIVLDLGSPVVDGYELLNNVSHRDQLSSVPVVATSAGSQSIDKASAVTAFLSKPIARQPLLKMVSRLLSKNGTVLVVDDNPNAVKLLKSYLETAGIETTVAYSGEDALKSIAAKPPALILLDLMMPGLSGFEVLDQLRASPETRSIPVIIVTARVLAEEERARLLEQANVINSKGELDREILVEQVNALLEEEV